MNEQNKVYSNTLRNTRVKMNSWKKTIGITLPRELIERAREHSLNLSRITEQALPSILDYLEPENDETSSEFLNQRCFRKKVEWGRGRELNPGARLHRPIGYQATSPRPQSWTFP